MEKIGIRRQDPLKVIVNRRSPRGGKPRAFAQLRRCVRCTVENSLDRARACLVIQTRVSLTASDVDVLRCTAGVGDDDGQRARDGLGNADAERLVRRTVDQNICAGERAREPGAVLLESDETNPRGSGSFEALSLGAVTEEDERGIAMRALAHSAERAQDDVPALFDGESTDPDKQRPGATIEKLAAPRLASRPGMKHANVDAKGTVDDVLHSGGAQMLGLRNAGDERGIERREQCSRAFREKVSDRVGRSRSEALGNRRADVRTHVVGVPKRRPHAGGVLAAREDADGRQIRRVRFEDVGPLGEDPRSDLVEAAEQMVGAVVGKGRARHSNDRRSSAPSALLRVAGFEVQLLVARPRCNHCVVVSQLA